MDLFEKYYTSAIYYLTRRPRSIKEVQDNLRKKKATDEVITNVLTKLQEQKYLNDEAFALWWREQRTRNRAKSDRVIKMELQQKGVAKEIIEKVLAVTDEVFTTDEQKARQLLEKRLPKVANLPRQEQFQKLAGYLGRRGFDYDVIKRTIDDCLGSKV
jgi:regulatory protein